MDVPEFTTMAEYLAEFTRQQAEVFQRFESWAKQPFETPESDAAELRYQEAVDRANALYRATARFKKRGGQ